MTTISKDAQIIKFFTQLAEKNGIGRTRLFKLAYLADLEARKLMGRPISSFEYQWYTHGPFDRSVYGAIEELETQGLAATRVIDHGGYQEKKLIDSGTPSAAGFSDAELEILHFVAARYMAVPLQELLDEIVYESKPMKSVEKRGDRLPMEIVDNLDRSRIGFDFETIVQADVAARGGDYVLASEFFDALRAADSGTSAVTH